MCPYYIMKRVGKVSYELNIPIDPISILPIEGLGVDKYLQCEEVPVENLDGQVRKMRNKEVAFVKVVQRNHLV